MSQGTACSRFAAIEARLLQRRWCTGPLAAGHLRTTTYARPVPDAPGSKPGFCRVAVHRAAGRWPPTYDYIRTICSRFTRIKARLLQSGWCTGPVALGHLRTTTYIRPVPEHQDRGQAFAEPLLHRATGRWPPTYAHVQTACSTCTGIEARLLHGRWSTGPLAAGHLHTSTYVRPRTYGLFQVHRHRCQALARSLVHKATGRWPPTYDHVRTTTYVRPRMYGLLHMHRHRCLALARSLVHRAAGKWPPTYDHVRTYGLFQIHRNRRQALAGSLVLRAAGCWPPAYDHVHTTTYVRPVPDSPASKPGSCTAAGAQGRWPLATYVRPRTHGLFQITGIEATLLQGRWCTGPLAAGHRRATTYVRPVRTRPTGIEAKLLQGRWCTGPLAAGHLRTTTYLRPVPEHRHRSKTPAEPLMQGPWLPATYVRPRTHGLFQIHQKSRPGSSSADGAQGR